MKFPYKVTNSPFFQQFEKCYEVWYWKLNSLDKKFAFWYRFTILKTPLKSIVEVWGILTQNLSTTHQSPKYLLRGIKNTFDLNELKVSSEANKSLLEVRENFTNFSETRGHITDSEGVIKWILFHRPENGPLYYNFIPQTLWKIGLSKNYAVTTYENLMFEGEIICDDKVIPVEQALGMQGHLCGTQQGHSWAWAHGNIFYNEKTGERVPCIVDILTARTKLGNFLTSPKISSVFIKYKDQIFSTSSITDLLKVHSYYEPSYWKLKIKNNKRKFIIDVDTEEASIAGVKYEDTDNTNLYCYNSKVATIKIKILDAVSNEETLLISPKLSAFEWVQREIWNKREILI
ncbi:MAG: hypothetical protein N3G21_05435 [Candidatus Hydrogenedentes bacterium]|nr:hypothetical protein [Candidatus Hydrogenedentota bacterium]